MFHKIPSLIAFLFIHILHIFKDEEFERKAIETISRNVVKKIVKVIDKVDLEFLMGLWFTCEDSDMLCHS
jgi:hypothetical protein